MCRNMAMQAYWESWHHYGLWKPKVVFTIHNAEFGLDRIGRAAYYCQRFTTVSPTYASEARQLAARERSLPDPETANSGTEMRMTPE